VENNRALINGVKHTLKRKLNLKNKLQIQEFNSYLISHLQGKVEPGIPLNIYHQTSEREFGLQAVDMFSWGLFRSHEKTDTEWLNVFKDRVRCDQELALK